MTHYTPQTRAGEKCVAPYYFTDPKIQSFRATHFLSGSCVPDYGSITLSAMVGPSRPRPSTEPPPSTATPSTHPLPLLRRAQGLWSQDRAGAMRFTFTRDGPAWLAVENNA